MARDVNEQCWTLVGYRRGGVWLARAVKRVSGGPTEVAFDAAWALAREERYGDVVGFLHTHPTPSVLPSRRDVRTMRAWCSAFGKPLVCLIARGERVAGVRFDDDESEGVPLETAEVFPGGLVVAVDQT